jgi:uncharacterized phiE125 gp8 family phage protein
MNIITVTPPPFEPVTLAEVYAHLRLEPEGSPATHEDDAMLQRQIATARAYVEQATRRALVLQTLRLSAPADSRPFGERLPAWLIDLLREAGTTFGLSLNTYMVTLLASHPGRRKPTKQNG